MHYIITGKKSWKRRRGRITSWQTAIKTIKLSLATTPSKKKHPKHSILVRENTWFRFNYSNYLNSLMRWKKSYSTLIGWQLAILVIREQNHVNFNYKNWNCLYVWNWRECNFALCNQSSNCFYDRARRHCLPRPRCGRTLRDGGVSWGAGTSTPSGTPYRWTTSRSWTRWPPKWDASQTYVTF